MSGASGARRRIRLMPLLVVGQLVVVSMIKAKQPTCTQYRVSQWGGSVGRWRQNGDSTALNASRLAR